jgi:hypothetical protein
MRARALPQDLLDAKADDSRPDLHRTAATDHDRADGSPRPAHRAQQPRRIPLQVSLWRLPGSLPDASPRPVISVPEEGCSALEGGPGRSTHLSTLTLKPTEEYGP